MRAFHAMLQELLDTGALDDDGPAGWYCRGVLSDLERVTRELSDMTKERDQYKRAYEARQGAIDDQSGDKMRYKAALSQIADLAVNALAAQPEK